MRIPKTRTRNRRYPAALLAMLAVFVPLAAACSETASTPSSMCAIVRGNGQGPDGANGDRRIHNVVLPDQNPGYDKGREEVRYFPCNSRDFIINPPGVKNANDKEVGDRHNPSEGFTKGGTRVRAWLTAYWTLNQDKETLKQFWEVCDKFNCATGDPNSGNANFSTEGWNGMLGEKFGTALDDAFFKVIAEFEDTVWQKPNADDYQRISARMSEVFAEVVRGKTGYSRDLFCGSGSTSGWENPDKPGDGKFTCGNVRIEIDSVFTADVSVQEGNEKSRQAEAAKDANATRLNAARELYGPNAGDWLGMQDLVEKCKAAAVPCTIHVGNPANGATVR